MSTGTWDLEEQEQDAVLQSDGRVVSEYSETYLYKANTNVRLTQAYIAADMGIFPGSPYYGDFNATAKSFSVRGGPTKTRGYNLAYLVTVKWSTNAPLNVSVSDDPTTRRTIWACRPQIHQRFVIRDSSNNLIVNTAGQPFDGGIPIDVRIGQVTANRNMPAAGYSMQSVLAYSGAVNLFPFLGGAAGTVQVDVETAEKYEGAYHFWEENWSFTYDPLGHQPKPASAGFYQRSAIGSNTLIRIQQDGEDVLEPEPLDSNGILVPIGSRPASCAFVTVNYFQQIDFGQFNLYPPS